MSYFRTLSALLALGVAAQAAPCNPHPFSPDGREPCRIAAGELKQAGDAAIGIGGQVEGLNRGIEEARRRYWAVYPDGPGAAAAERNLLDALWTKDMYYMMFAIHTGIGGDMAKMGNVMALLSGDLSIKSIDKFPTNLDGGIRPYAFPLFADWVNALRRSNGREKDGTWANPMLLGIAVQDTSNWRTAYEDARNWAELVSSGKNLAKYISPKAYIYGQMEADVCGALALAKPDDLPNPAEATQGLYDLFVEMFGEKQVLDAAGRTLRAPKNSMGGLAPRAPVEIGSYVLSSSPNPYFLFLTDVTKSSSQAYAIALAFDPNAVLKTGPTATFSSRQPWDTAYSVFKQLAARYGKDNVLAAAARLESAPKAPQGTILGDPQAQPLRYWFQALLKDPKAAIPDGQVPHFLASSYDPRWLGKSITVRGTVSRVDVDKNGSPLYATIYFKESKNVTGFSPYSDMLQSSYGKDFGGLVGKPVELEGEVSSWRESGGVRILDLRQIKLLDAAGLTAGFHESRPDWLSAAAPTPAQNLVDSPKYVSWKKCPVGTQVVLENRVLTETGAGTNLFTRTPTSRIAMKLTSVDDRRAVVTATSTIFSRNGQSNQTAPTELTFPARENPTVHDSSVVVTTGEETLVINGKQIPTQWESVARAGDPLQFTKTWRSPDVPGGLVLEHRQSSMNMGGKPFRSIAEAIYAPIDGVTPVLGDRTPPAAASPTAASGDRSEMLKRYNDQMSRMTRARVGLMQWQRAHAAAGERLPPDIQAAASRMIPQSTAARSAMAQSNDSQSSEALNTWEGTLKLIEDFLSR